MVLSSPAIVSSASSPPTGAGSRKQTLAQRGSSYAGGVGQDGQDAAALRSSFPTPPRASVEAIEQALSILDGRVSPDVITYNTLIEICSKSALHGGADLKDGIQVVGLMQSQVMIEPMMHACTRAISLHGCL